MFKKIGLMVLTAGLVAVAAPMAMQAEVPGPHPAYLHALSDLRLARHYLNDGWAWAPVKHDDDAAIREIDSAIGEIKKAGYDVFLVLEATIGFNRREEGSDNEEEEVEVSEEPKRNFEATGKIKFTSQDHRFLRALKIAVDDENR